MRSISAAFGGTCADPDPTCHSRGRGGRADGPLSALDGRQRRTSRYSRRACVRNAVTLMLGDRRFAVPQSSEQALAGSAAAERSRPIAVDRTVAKARPKPQAQVSGLRLRSRVHLRPRRRVALSGEERPRVQKPAHASRQHGTDPGSSSDRAEAIAEGRTIAVTSRASAQSGAARLASFSSLSAQARPRPQDLSRRSRCAARQNTRPSLAPRLTLHSEDALRRLQAVRAGASLRSSSADGADGGRTLDAVLRGRDRRTAGGLAAAARLRAGVPRGSAAKAAARGHREGGAAVVGDPLRGPDRRRGRDAGP